MKYLRKEKMYEMNIWELKNFVLEVASFYRIKHIETSILLTCCIDELRDLIACNEILHDTIFKQLKHYIEVETEAKEIEKHLVIMKLLLQWKNPKYAKYRETFKKKLTGMIQPYFTSDLYVLMRHLGKVDVNEYYWMDDEIQKYFLCEIYLIEEDYKMAYTYLKDCRYVGVLQEYDYELRRYSSSKYRKHILKEPLFNINLGDQLWMRSQLRY